MIYTSVDTGRRMNSHIKIINIAGSAGMSIPTLRARIVRWFPRDSTAAPAFFLSSTHQPLVYMYNVQNALHCVTCLVDLRCCSVPDPDTHMFRPGSGSVSEKPGKKCVKDLATTERGTLNVLLCQK